MPASSTSLMICSGSRSPRQGFVQLLDEPVALTVDDPLAEPLLDGPSGTILDGSLVDRHVLEDLQQSRERVVALVSSRERAGGTPAVVYEVQADVALVIGGCG
ncbi:MAG: hypothetical protein M5U19_13690 [Microthrixaceae bacterium]|nr:hypothetical protein [Microthrixaceae bacterium]